MKTFYDASTPPPAEPATDGVGFYIGGDTPHVWTIEEINASRRRYRLPIFTRSFGGVLPRLDATAAIQRLQQIGAPRGTVTALDLEELQDPAYVSGYGALLHAAGYGVLPYGSLAFVTANPALDGWWAADWDGVAGLDADDPAGVVGVQMKSPTSSGLPGYDLSVFVDSVVFWDTKPVPPPPPPPPPVVGPPTRIPGSDLMNVEWKATTGSDGTLYVLVPIPPGCSHMVSCSADVLSAWALDPYHPAHDGDLGTNALGKSGVVCEPCVPLQGGSQYLRLAGGTPSHFYTGHAQFV